MITLQPMVVDPATLKWVPSSPEHYTQVQISESDFMRHLADNARRLETPNGDVTAYRNIPAGIVTPLVIVEGR